MAPSRNSFSAADRGNLPGNLAKEPAETVKWNTENDTAREAAEDMADTVIRRLDEENEEIGDFIHEGFTRYGLQNGVELNYEDFCFAAENGEGRTVGVITGRAYYNEVHIGDLIVDEAYRGSGLGRALVGTVENAFRGKGYEVITLTTFGFQAPVFYRKLGFDVEFIRENEDPKLSKYFLRKSLEKGL